MVFKKIVWNPVDTKAIENFEDIAATVFEEKIILPTIIDDRFWKFVAIWNITFCL